MSEKSAKELKKLLFNNKQNGTEVMSDDELKLCDTFCEGYKGFLWGNKTEREVAAWAEETAKAAGFTKFDEFGSPLAPGQKVYVANRGKAIRAKRALKRACVSLPLTLTLPELT